MGLLQHDVGCKDGMSKLIKKSQYDAETDSKRVGLAFVVQAAFLNVSCKAVSMAVTQPDLELAVVNRRWFLGSDQHRAMFDLSHVQVVGSSVTHHCCRVFCV